MSGYVPVFRSVFHGSLCGKFPDLPLWLVLLALSDRNGEIDAHPSYIATVSGIAVDQVAECIRRFCEPDPSSRTPDEDGRRLVPIEGRGFGWRIINHGKYREKARLMAKNEREVASGREAERKRHSRQEPETPPVSAGVRRCPPMSDPSDSYTNKDKNPPTPRKRGGAATRASPKTPIPDAFPDFAADPELAAYVAKHLPDVDLVNFAEAYRTKALAKGWVYANWRAALQEYCRNNAPNSGHWSSGQYPRKAAAGIQWQ